MLLRDWKIIRIVIDAFFDMLCKPFVSDSLTVHI